MNYVHLTRGTVVVQLSVQMLCINGVFELIYDGDLIEKALIRLGMRLRRLNQQPPIRELVSDFVPRHSRNLRPGLATA